MISSQKKMCTKTARGYIEEVSNDLDKDKIKVKVAYEVEGVSFMVEEYVDHKIEIVKDGNTILGTKKVPVIGELEIGKELEIKYNPQKPNKAYIKGNTD